MSILIQSCINTFEIVVKKLNNGDRIKMVNINGVPTYFPENFNDIDCYQVLMEE
ncbi:hypothetical protein [Paucisalibacillus sp. EB02]|uniref:hypothetical protein n=1 Tax=Paucisalibacillus sp. EB02 TaxID=1347087 RepID=UPI0004B6BC70|nr:hypothetical protein [Paucisalibacillus sp. EB02]